MSQPLLVEIIAYAPTSYYHCTHCEVAWREMGVNNRVHAEQLENSLPPDLAQEYAGISAWVKDVFRRHCDQVIVHVIDAASIEGFFKSLRYGVRKYPAVIINHESRYSGGALQEASLDIDQRLLQAAS